MTTASYRFLKTRRGAVYFANATVAVSWPRQATAAEVVVDLGQADSEAGEIGAGEMPGWLDAAVAGAASALGSLPATDGDGAHARVTITRIVGSMMDTREDVVRCSAAIATAQALGCADRASAPVWRDDGWHVDFTGDAGAA